MDFVAIDFETASGNANSACQLGAVRVRNSKIVDEKCWMICPPRLYFSPRNIAVHGIRPRDVSASPKFDRLWPEVQNFVGEQVLVAHNARFDLGVLIATLAAYNLKPGQLTFHCTRTMARAAWPGRSRYGLKPLAESLRIQFKHHDALEDARSCALIAIATAEDVPPNANWKAVEEQLKIKPGQFRDGRLTSPIAIGRGRKAISSGGRQATDKWGFPDARARQIGSVEPQSIVRASDGSKPLQGKTIALLGSLRGTSVDQSQQLINSLGGECASNIDSNTTYVVACGITLEEARRIVRDTLTPKIASSDEGKNQQAADSEERPNKIRILSERQFRALLPGGKAAAW
ncbi:MAG: exonuclease domain-containing protein [Pirellulaceae bacterium]